MIEILELIEKDSRLNAQQLSKILGATEEEIKDPNGGSIGCFGWLMVALLLLIMLPTILISILTSP